MKIECPQCGVSGSLDDKFAGKTIKCPKCGSRFSAGQKPVAAQTSVSEGSAATTSQTSQTDSTDSSNGNLSDSPGTAENSEGISAVDEGSVSEPLTMESEPADDLASEPPPSPSQHGIDVPPVRQAVSQVKRDPWTGQEEDVYPLQDWNLGQVLREAWELTQGVKKAIWLGMLVMFVVLFGVNFVEEILFRTLVDRNGLVAYILEIIVYAVTAFFTAGLMYMGVKQATDREVVWNDIFSASPVWGQVFIAYLLQTVLLFIGFMLLVLPGIYLTIGYMMTYSLIIDKGMSPWQAMETSRKAIHKVWWKVFGLYLVIVLICAVSAIPLGIGLVWTLPMSVVVSGVVYRYLFVIE